LENIEHLRKQFQAIGSDLVVNHPKARHPRGMNVVRIKGVNGGKETFSFHGVLDETDLKVTQVDASGRHLLLHFDNIAGGTKGKILCGHDERHYFTAPVPGNPTSITMAKEMLLPKEFLDAHKKKGRRKSLLKRKNETGMRQGEWIFVKDDPPHLDPDLIKKKEPLSRGRGSKPHIVDEIYSFGGQQVWVHNRYAPNGVSQATHEETLRTNADNFDIKIGWRTMTRDAKVYARGKVRHPDHSTIELRGWHRVYMNTESASVIAEKSVFLD